MKKPHHTTEAWIIHQGTHGVVTDRLGEAYLEKDDPLRATSPVGLYFHTEEAAVDALLEHLRAVAERSALVVAPVPRVGPRYGDWQWEKVHGAPQWAWRVHRLSIAPTREEDGVECSATFDVQVLAQKDVRTYVDVDGEKRSIGWTRQSVAIEDWAPYQKPKDWGNDPSPVEDGRVVCSQIIRPERVILRWGDAAPATTEEP